MEATRRDGRAQRQPGAAPFLVVARNPMYVPIISHEYGDSAFKRFN